MWAADAHLQAAQTARDCSANPRFPSCTVLDMNDAEQGGKRRKKTYSKPCQLPPLPDQVDHRHLPLPDSVLSSDCW